MERALGSDLLLFSPRTWTAPGTALLLCPSGCTLHPITQHQYPRSIPEQDCERVCSLISCAELLGVDPGPPTFLPSCSAENDQETCAKL